MPSIEKVLVRTWISAVWALVCWLAPSLVVAEEFAFRRWAVIASRELQQSGLSDLLTAELTAGLIELVEREQLDAITKEIELSKLLGADASAQRLKVGQLLKADALVLLSLVDFEKQRSLRIVMSDCLFGSRLKLEHRRFNVSAVDELARETAAMVVEVQKKYARGVEQIVAVSPFLSKNLTHEFDHLQFGFAGLLGDLLSQQPGVAVLEIEEARAIGEEIRVSTSELKRRRVPVFVEGDYEVRPREAAPKAAPQMPDAKSEDELRGQQLKLVVRLRDGQAERQPLERTLDSMPDTIRWLSSIAEEHMAGAARGTRPTTLAQFFESSSQPLAKRR